MKNYVERFDSLQDYQISEEMLGAYVEHNLNPTEDMYVSELIDSDPQLYSYYQEVESLPLDDAMNADYDFPEDEYTNYIIHVPEDVELQNPIEDFDSPWVSYPETETLPDYYPDDLSDHTQGDDVNGGYIDDGIDDYNIAGYESADDFNDDDHDTDVHPDYFDDIDC